MADDLGVLDFIEAQAGGGRQRSLADVAGFQYVMSRCRQDAAGAAPQIRWFLEPQGFMEALAAENPDREPLRRGKSWIEVFKNQGFGGLQAVGGFIEVGQKPFQIIHRTAVYAPGRGPGRWSSWAFPTAGSSCPSLGFPAT